MFSVLILTLNEETALPGCLSSVAFCDDIVVLDSGSTDRTVALAEAAGARVVARAFDSFGGQRNFAQHSIKFRHPWVFHMDADERMTPELREECEEASKRLDLEGFRASPKMLFEGRWVPHCTDYPAFQARMVRAPEFEFIDVGHGQREAPSMRVENLRHSYLHDMSIYGEESWLAKHRRYAAAEAKALRTAGDHPSFGDLFDGDRLVRRRALKHLSFILPCRPAFRFVYQYILRRGFLDGREGLRYCWLLSRYEGFISEETARLRREAKIGR